MHSRLTQIPAIDHVMARLSRCESGHFMRKAYQSMLRNLVI